MTADSGGYVYLLLCFHNHQPVGNFDGVIEEAYEKAYLPFLRILAGYPEIKITLHYSGFLLSWLLKRKEEFGQLLARLVERGQVELLGGGIYEPILPMIPERDRIGQIEKMGERMRAFFGRRPRGIWLAERVWEPSLPLTLRKARVEYLPLDDYHFVRAGKDLDELDGYFITEYNGHAVKVFPGLELLRYTIPFREPAETLMYLEKLRGKRRVAPAAVFADDGEKFGVWPGTHRHVYEDGWLKKFFDLIVSKREWLKTATFGEYADRFPPRGRVYLPSTSYPEMGEWTLPPTKARAFGRYLKKRREGELGDMGQFLTGGHFRSFFDKYEESNQMHKRMLLVSEMVDRAASSADQAERDTMCDALFRAQGNDPYWHGVFGGLYLPHLRDSVYRNLLRAERIASRVLKKGKRFWSEILRGDINRDGKEEVLMRTGKLVLLIHPADGGTISELSFMERGFNALNVLTRRKEGYHFDLERAGDNGLSGDGTVSIHDAMKVKEGVSLENLKFDSHVLRSFRDVLYDAGTHPADLLGNGKEPLAINHGTANNPSCMMSEEKGAVRTIYEMSVGGNRLSLEKIVFVDSKREEVRFKVRVGSLFGEKVSLVYATLWHVNFLAPDDEGRRFVAYPADVPGERLASEGALAGVEEFGIRDEWQGFVMTFESGNSFGVSYSPIYTLSLSESGVESVYQGSTIRLLFPLEIKPGGFAEVDFRISARDL